MYREKITVMPSEAACTNEIKLRALLNRLQDVASVAVSDLEGSPADLMRRGYAWVILRYSLEVERRLPAMDDSMVIETRHTLNDGFHTLRAFRVFIDGNEAETLVLARTSWVLIDLAAGRPVRALQHLPEVFSGVADAPPIDPEFAPVPKLSGAALKNVPVLREIDFPVRFHDLDSNGHVNNAVYFEWICESTPLDLMAWTVRSVNAEFRVSAKYGDTVRVRVKAAECAAGPEGEDRDFTCFAYDITRAGGGEHPVARFYASWTQLGPGPAGVTEKA